MTSIIGLNRLIYFSTLIFLLVFTQGCMVIGNGAVTTEGNPPELNYLPVGVPFLLGGNGTAVPISKNVSITAAHVARLDYSSVIAYHPYCDVALIESDNSDKNILEMGLVYSGEIIYNHGYDLLGREISSNGKYVTDSTVDGYPECIYSLNIAPQVSGMSGGAVLNESGELVGIIHGIGLTPPVMLDSNEELLLDRYSYFVPISIIEDWINTHIDLHKN